MSPPPSTPIWPPARKKRRVNDENQPPETPGTPTPRTTKEREGELEILRLTSHEPTPLSRRFKNGFVAPSPKTPSHQPYALASTGRKREKPFAFPISTAIRPLDSLSHAEWNALAHKYDLLKENQSLREYQVEGANCIISRKSDLCVVAPTGAGKSTLWTLPLLAREEGISLVVVPFTTLGVQGENRHRNSKIAATFLCSGNASTSVLERIAQGKERHVVYACPEMLETPAVARVLHSTSFQQRL
ncbi:hypothetical protein DFP72DRAFT_1017954 [Ephemerocybe angulata]|uniref:DNA 3'-5' helicase n=1 Tax=Ephemerocybe angulata TaxID=980116 RepID=A0A8H6HG36_9AGAR|nr:hypothetical protein DFP72DRAFT_1017954 [Tulosesus angulatus]